MTNSENAKKSSKDWGIIEKKDKHGRVSFYARIVRVEGNGKKKQYTRKAESKSHAKRLRDELSEQFDEGGENAIEGNKLTFSKLCEIYQEKKLFAAQYQGEGQSKEKISGVRSLASVLHYLKVLRESFGAKLIRNISYSEIEQFKTKRRLTPSKRGERSNADVNRTLALLRTMMNFAIQEGWLNKSPFERGKPLISLSTEKKRDRVLGFNEEARLLSFCIERRSHLKPILIMALDTAMRKGEILSLTWENVDFDTRSINIFATNTKTQSARTVGITQRLFDELSRLWNESPKNLSGLVFGIQDIKRSFASVCKDAVVKDFRFHDCRHTAISRMVAAGLPPAQIQRLSGHTQANTFLRYVNNDQDAITRIADVLTAFNQQNAIQEQESEKFLN